MRLIISNFQIVFFCGSGVEFLLAIYLTFTSLNCLKNH